MRRLVLLILLACSSVASANSYPFGHFPQRPQLEFLDDGRTMQLLREFVYIDQHKKTWTSKAGSKVDGASIPRVLWSFVGGPFEGRYRNASIVHDTECDLKQDEWRAVHRMFYNATRAGGVGPIKGKLMYLAVYRFGPRWKLAPPVEHIPAAMAKDYLTRVLVILRRDHRIGKITLDELEKKTYEDVLKEVPDGDPDLARVRSLLSERELLDAPGLTLENFQELVRRLDAALFLENDTPPRG